MEKNEDQGEQVSSMRRYSEIKRMQRVMRESEKPNKMSPDWLRTANPLFHFAKTINQSLLQ